MKKKIEAYEIGVPLGDETKEEGLDWGTGYPEASMLDLIDLKGQDMKGPRSLHGEQYGRIKPFGPPFREKAIKRPARAIDGSVWGVRGRRTDICGVADKRMMK